MKSRAGARAHLLGQQVHHVKLLEGGENGDDDRRGDDGADGRQGDVPRPLQPGGAVEDGAFIVAPVDALQSAVHNHNHKRQRQPEIDHRAAEEGREIRGEPAHGFSAQGFHQLVEEAKLRIEDTGLPKKDGYIPRHSPGKHQKGLIDLPGAELGDVEGAGQEKGKHQLEEHAHRRPQYRCQQRREEAGIKDEEGTIVVLKADDGKVKPVVDAHVGEGDEESVENGEDHHQRDEDERRRGDKIAHEHGFFLLVHRLTACWR